VQTSALRPGRQLRVTQQARKPGHALEDVDVGLCLQLRAGEGAGEHAYDEAGSGLHPCLEVVRGVAGHEDPSYVGRADVRDATEDDVGGGSARPHEVVGHEYVDGRADGPAETGIGFFITNTIHHFQFNQVLTYGLMMLVIIAVDLLSAWPRKRITASTAPSA
jgi:hypothetical protein